MTFLLRDQDRDRLLGLLDYLAERALELEDNEATGLTASEAAATARGILERVAPTGGLAPAGVWAVESPGSIDVHLEPCLEPDSVEGAVERVVERLGYRGKVLLRIVDDAAAVPGEGPWQIKVLPGEAARIANPPVELVVRRFERKNLHRWTLLRASEELAATIAAPPHMAAGVLAALAMGYEHAPQSAVEHVSASEGRAYAILRPPRGGLVAYELRDEGAV